jgi:hypothetical protein
VASYDPCVASRARIFEHRFEIPAHERRDDLAHGLAKLSALDSLVCSATRVIDHDV